MKCPRCGKKAFLVFSYVQRKGLNKYTKEAYRQDKRSESVMLKQYQCCNGHGQFLYKSDKPYPDKYAFGAEVPSFKLINPRVSWMTREEWEKAEKTKSRKG